MIIGQWSSYNRTWFIGQEIQRNSNLNDPSGSNYVWLENEKKTCDFFFIQTKHFSLANKAE
jgi:hypothetical protein